MRDIDFRANVTFDREGFVEKGQDVLDNRRVDEERIDEYAGSLEELIASSSSISNESVERLIQEVSEFREVLKGKRNSRDCYEWIFDDYFSLRARQETSE